MQCQAIKIQFSMGRSGAVIHQPMQSLVAMKSFGDQVLLPSFLKQMFLETEKLQQDDVHDIQTIGIFVCCFKILIH